MGAMKVKRRIKKNSLHSLLYLSKPLNVKGICSFMRDMLLLTGANRLFSFECTLRAGALVWYTFHSQYRHSWFPEDDLPVFPVWSYVEVLQILQQQRRTPATCIKLLDCFNVHLSFLMGLLVFSVDILKFL